ncbi:MAG: class I SAM-dependent methyltransferase [Thermoplasmata archaeon]
MDTEVRESRVEWGTFEWSEFEAMFLERLAMEDFSDRTVLDLGTGQGRLALHLAPRAGRVVGIDTDVEALAAARDRARALRIANVTFIPADADSANYRLLPRSPLDYVVANHFMSEGAIHGASVGLRLGGRFLFACHHRDQWIESGREGRFSFGEDRMRALLSAADLSLGFLGIERRIVTYSNLHELGRAHPELETKFRADGRWEALANRFGGGPAQLTWSTLVGVAAKP